MFKCEIGSFGDWEGFNERQSGAYKVLADSEWPGSGLGRMVRVTLCSS